MSKMIAGGVLAVMMLWSLPVFAQGGGGTLLPVELAVPFGSIAGKLLLRGPHMVFWDEEQPDASVVVGKENIESLRAEAGEITVQLRQPMRNRSGEVSRMVFRVAGDVDAGQARSWYASGGSGAVADSRSPEQMTTYEARHDHRVGECRGRLIVEADRISYESVSAASHSRRWTLKEIKEIKQPNPYRLDIQPFSGPGYSLRLDGTGMEPTEYKALVDRVTTARATR